MSQIKILVVDDHKLVCEGLKSILAFEKNFKIVGDAQDGEAAINLAKKFQPDVVVMDVRMPEVDGVTACRRIKSIRPATKVIMLSVFDDEEEIIASIEAGASGYILKDLSPEELVDVIHTVEGEQSFLHPTVTQKVFNKISQLASEHARVGKVAFGLTAREHEVLILIVSGLTNKEIAKRLCVSESTIKTHVSHILRKLGESNRKGAILRALKARLVQVD